MQNSALLSGELKLFGHDLPPNRAKKCLVHFGYWRVKQILTHDHK